MAQIVGVRFKGAGRVYHFHASGLGLGVHDDVVVQTAQGLEVGKVVTAPDKMSPSDMGEPLKPGLRKAEDHDFARVEALKEKGKEAKVKCQQMIAQFELPMKLLAADWSLDGSCLNFLFSAEERVDFRALVRELTKTFRTRVELRQVGARDEAKIVGGCGRCGRPLCCATHLTSFESVSMKMAKEQDLPLNPGKISGVCGRLLCCLGYECAQYKEMKASLPRGGTIVTTSEGEAKVVGSNTLKQTVTVQLESDARIEVALSDLVTKKEPEPAISSAPKPKRRRRRKP
ncbi:MAG: stage 0 sporulation family protein [Chloroflexi bacterium]|nr:stage 0 sporulation family protein [Chloroflexota bacterium]